MATTYGTLHDDWVKSEEHLHNVRQVDALGKCPLDARQGPHYSPRGIPRRVKVAGFAEQAQARPCQLLGAWVCSTRALFNDLTRMVWLPYTHAIISSGRKICTIQPIAEPFLGKTNPIQSKKVMATLKTRARRGGLYQHERS
jgi:hypothetical protein